MARALWEIRTAIFPGVNNMSSIRVPQGGVVYCTSMRTVCNARMLVNRLSAAQMAVMWPISISADKGVEGNHYLHVLLVGVTLRVNY
jgi:hypothetical protein